MEANGSCTDPNTARRLNANSGILLLIILNLIFESVVKELHGQLCNTLLEKNVYGQKQHREEDACKNSIPYINHFIL